MNNFEARTPHEQIGQMSLWWDPKCPLKRRADILEKMRSIKTRRALRSKWSTSRARSAYERRGEANLFAPDRGSEPRKPWIVRIYYRSIGDEILCFEATGLTEPQATSLHSECCEHQGYANAYTSRSTWLPPLGSDAVAAHRWRADKEAPPLRHGARLVVLPSQRTECVIVENEDANVALSAA